MKCDTLKKNLKHTKNVNVNFSKIILEDRKESHKLLEYKNVISQMIRIKFK